MQLLESKKNMSKMQNTEEQNINNPKQAHCENKSSQRPLFLDKSDYGWDGDY